MSAKLPKVILLEVPDGENPHYALNAVCFALHGLRRRPILGKLADSARLIDLEAMRQKGPYGDAFGSDAEVHDQGYNACLSDIGGVR